jgi:hypothetical protein
VNRVRLRVISDEETLEGKSPPDFERISRLAPVGSSDHRGVVHIAVTLASRTVTATVPPSAQQELTCGISAARLWLEGKSSEAEIKKARSRCFQAVVGIEGLTAQAVRTASQHLAAPGQTALDHHANHIVERYARLGAHFAVSAVCHLLDAISDPKQAPEVLQDIEGALAYQATGLGAARHPAFRKAAWDQAEWEASRPGQEGSPGEQRSALAIQVFHEYLGGRWRIHADSQRLAHQSFVSWALSGRKASANSRLQ